MGVRFALLGLGCSAAGCVEAPQEPLFVELRYQGDPELGPPDEEGVSIQLSDAKLAFGPLYLCAGTQAGELCDSARMEWVDSAVLDLKAAEEIAFGELSGVSGTVRSWMLDYGITSLLTASEPVASEAANSIGGNSLLLEGVADIDGTSIPFVVEVRTAQSETTERGVQVLRKSVSESFEHTLSEETAAMSFSFGADAWLSPLGRAAFEAQVDELCIVGESEECEEVVFSPDSETSETISQLMTSEGRPLFRLR